MSSKTKPWRILHTADTQLGYKQYGFQDRLNDFNAAVDYVFAQALGLNIDVINLAGDLFQMPNPPASCVTCLQRNVYSALNKNINVVGVEGNHDPADVANAWLMACGITPLDAGHPTITTLTDPEKGTLRIAGLNYYRTPVLLQKIQELVTASKDTGGFDVLVLHCSVAEMAGFRGVDLTAAQIAHMVRPAGCRLVLMGDIHDGKQLEVGGVMFSYSGSLEMTALDEQPQKTFDVVEISPDNVKITLHPIPNRPVVNFHVSADEDVDKVLAVLEEHKGTKPLFIITYHKSVPNFQQRVKPMLEGKCLFRLIPLDNPDTINIDILAQLSQQSFERKGALNNLRDVVVNEFQYPEDSDRFQLIMQMMETPDQAAQICMDYAKSRGIQLVVA